MKKPFAVGDRVAVYGGNNQPFEDEICEVGEVMSREQIVPWVTELITERDQLRTENAELKARLKRACETLRMNGDGHDHSDMPGVTYDNCRGCIADELEKG